ncbi:MAG: hypothetical protein Q9218_004904 [Villophora microphyllina]
MSDLDSMLGNLQPVTHVLRSNKFPSDVASRNGCGQCKKRRIKCDEVRPACSNCVKHSITCDFQTSNSQAQSPLHPPKLRSHGSDTKSPGSARSKTIPRPVISNSLQLGELQMGDLELLHQFATETCYTTSNKKDSHDLWRVTVCKEGLNNDFLMRGILAIAALHLSHLRPDQAHQYQNIAASHQDKALSVFRVNVPNVTESNCHAFFALSSLIVVYGFASPRKPGTAVFTDEGQDSEDWLPLIRGVNSILQQAWPVVGGGPLRGLLQPGVFNTTDTRLPRAADLQLKSLIDLCQSADAGDEAIDAYIEAVKALRKCYAKIFTRSSVECEVGTAFTWPVEVPNKFIELLRARAPHALIILAHYCVVLHHLNDYWWMNGWGAHLIENIYNELQDPWRDWIQWPSETISRNEKCLVWRPLSPELGPTPTPGAMSNGMASTSTGPPSLNGG